MIAFKPPLIVQRAEDDKTQSSAEFLAHCCPLSMRAIDRAGHTQAGHTQTGQPLATPELSPNDCLQATTNRATS